MELDFLTTLQRWLDAFHAAGKMKLPTWVDAAVFARYQLKMRILFKFDGGLFASVLFQLEASTLFIKKLVNNNNKKKNYIRIIFITVF